MAEYDAMIIGGGAAGLMAAARLAGGGLHVALIEQSDRVGRKILATGNGRCNVLNMRLGEERYFSRDIDCPAEIDNWDKISVPSCWQTTGYEKPDAAC